jgi:hypothetical protein
VLIAIVVVVIVLGASVRVIGMDWGLPYLHHPDEPTTMVVMQTMVRNRDPNPHFFHWPSLPFYIQGVAYAAYVGAGTALGYFGGPQDVSLPEFQMVGTGILGNPNVLRVGRTVAVAFGLGIVAIGLSLAWRLSRRYWIVGVAGAFLALEPMLVRNSRWMVPDVFVAFFTFAAIGMSVLILRSGRWWQYAVAGAFVGFAASSKYNAALVAVAIVVAHLFRYRMKFFTEPGIYIAAVASAVAFVFTTPALIFANSEAWGGITYDLQHYGTGHWGAEGDVLAFYASALWRNVGPILFLIPFAFAVRNIRREVAVILAFPIIHFALLLAFFVRFERNLLPAIAPLLLAAALGVWGLWQVLADRNLSRNAAAVVTAVVVIAATAIPLIQLVDDMDRYSGDHRAEARTWINSNIPSGATIVRDVYSPYLDDDRYRLVGKGLLLGDEEVFDTGIDYIVFTDRGSGRFVDDPDRYPIEMERYERLRRDFCVVRAFGGFEPSVVFAACPAS